MDVGPNLPAHAQSRCPRCGYDLRGVMGLWTESCPLDGTCSECGLHWSWAEMMNPALRHPLWCIEFAPSARSPKVVLRTIAEQFRPWRFWTALRLEHPVRPRRLAVFVLWLLVLFAALWYAGYALFMGTIFEQVADGQARGLVYSASPERIWLEAVLMPWSDESIGTVTRPNWRRTGSIGAPSGYFEWWFTQSTYDFAGTWWEADLRWGMLAPLAVIGSWMFALALTPVWMRGEPLRAAHFARLAVYALSFVVLNRLATLAAFASPLFGYDEVIARPEIMTWQLFAFALMFIASLPWWIYASRRYLRLRRPWRVALVVHLFGFVAPLGALGLLRIVSVGFEFVG